MSAAPESLGEDTALRRSPEMFSAEMDGDVVMMSLSRGEYFGLGGIGPQLWNWLETARTPAALRSLVLRTFDVDEATCRRDVDEFLSAMLAKGLVQRC